MKKVVKCLLITFVGIIAAQASEVASETSINQDNTVQVVSKESPTYFYQLPFEERLPHVEFINSFASKIGKSPEESKNFVTRVLKEIPVESWKYFPIFYESIPENIKKQYGFCFEYIVKFLETKK